MTTDYDQARDTGARADISAGGPFIFLEWMGLRFQQDSQKRNYYLSNAMDRLPIILTIEPELNVIDLKQNAAIEVKPL